LLLPGAGSIESRVGHYITSLAALKVYQSRSSLGGKGDKVKRLTKRRVVDVF
jgi:hypothetical protein